MKKLPDDYRLRQWRIASTRHKQNARQQKTHRRKPPKPKSSPRKPRHERRQFRSLSGYQIIPAPKQIVMHPRDIHKTARFIQKLRGKTNRNLFIDFFKTDFLSALGAVYLYSEIDRIQSQSGVTIKLRSKAGSQVRNALRNTGILALCGDTEMPDRGMLPIIRGERDEGLPDITKYLMKTALLNRQLEINNQDYAEWLVNKAIGEAMLNVGYHAYPDRTDRRFWWAIAAIISNQLHIALCDRGVGIPETLRTKSWFSPILETLSVGSDDGKIIRSAMQYTRSSRHHPGGGLGSRDIQNLVLEMGKGQLTIVRGRGYYRLQGEGGRDPSKNIGHNVGGTFILWRIPLQH